LARNDSLDLAFSLSLLRKRYNAHGVAVVLRTWK